MKETKSEGKKESTSPPEKGHVHPYVYHSTTDSKQSTIIWATLEFLHSPDHAHPTYPGTVTVHQRSKMLSNHYLNSLYHTVIPVGPPHTLCELIVMPPVHPSPSLPNKPS